MGWFDEQIRLRKMSDQEIFEDSLFGMAAVVLGSSKSGKIDDDRLVTKAAIDDILKYYRLKPADIPESITDAEEQMDYALRPHGLMRRNVELRPGWQKDCFGPMIVRRKEDGLPVAVLPESTFGYYYKEGAKKIPVTPRTAETFSEDAVCFYRPLPLKSIGIPDLFVWLRHCISSGDVLLFACMTLVVTLTGLIIPNITKVLTGMVLESGSRTFLAGTAAFILAVTVSSQLFSMIRDLLMNRLEMKTDLAVEAAVMMRLMGLPASFFRKYSSGELQKRAESVNELANLLLGSVFSTGMVSLVSLLYVFQIFRFAPCLVGPSLLVILVTTVFGLVTAIVQIGVSKKQIEFGARENGVSFALISGVQKIKLAGAEKRAFAKWAEAFTKSAEVTYNPPVFLKVNAAVMRALSFAGSILLYFFAVRGNVQPSDYLAFSVSYGQVAGAFAALSDIAVSIARIRPILEMAEPILKEAPEMAEDREILTQPNGSIELNNVYFRYNENMPYVVNGLSLKIHPGEYIAIVGRTGCGKSTLVRLLLGFEKPERGAVYYDGRDLAGLDLQSLRKKIGTVTQDGGLFQGDIFSNITISAPQLTLKEAWEAAEMAGIADDIRAMPMGMQTIISEGSGGISGGQKQRIMIARAVAPKPRILIFDEATSALDNLTQKQVSEALDSLRCTRIVIAHRLSTIRHCDRILVLDGGRILEDGTYDELIEKKGFFAELVERQRL